MSISDWLTWIVLAYIFIWLVLKSAGIINTPLWLEYSPLFCAVYLAGKYVKEISHIKEKVEKTDVNVEKTEVKVEGIDKRVINLESDVSTIKNDVSTLKDDVSTLRDDVEILKKD